MAKKPLLLCILDGFGWVPDQTYGNAIVAPQAEAFIRAFNGLLEEQGWVRQ